MPNIPTPEEISAKVRELVNQGLPYLDQARGYVQSVLLLPFVPDALRRWLQFLDLVLQVIQHATNFQQGLNSFAPLAVSL